MLSFYRRASGSTGAGSAVRPHPDFQISAASDDRFEGVQLCTCAGGVALNCCQFRFEDGGLSLSLSRRCVGTRVTGSVPNGPRLFYAGPDFVARGMSSASTSQSPALTEGESTTANDNARPHDPGADSAGPARSRLSLQLDQRSLHFSVNAWVLIVALIGILPLATRQLQYKGYRLSLLGTTCTTGYALFALYGLPRVGNTQVVQAWGHLVTSSKDFIPFMYCLMFVTSKLHFKLVLVPVICWALEHVARFLRRHFTNSSLYRAYLEPLCTWVDRNTTAVNFLIANAEILLGFLLILSLFSSVDLPCLFLISPLPVPT
ncbi:hypothetical protein ACQ4PT_023664 [Festuca glaucescens]